MANAAFFRRNPANVDCGDGGCGDANGDRGDDGCGDAVVDCGDDDCGDTIVGLAVVVAGHSHVRCSRTRTRKGYSNSKFNPRK